jgi:hypothetical protein
MKQYRRLVCVRRSHLKKLAPISMLFIMLVFMLLTFTTLASASPDIILEPSFETVADWTYFESETAFTDGARSGTWKTQGTYSYKFSSTGAEPISYNAYCQILQSVDFTKLDTISFDAYLYCATTGRFKASVFVGVNEVWTTECPRTATEYLHEEIDVSEYSSSHNLIFRITCIRTQGSSKEQINYFDNIKTWGSFSDSAHTTVDNDFTTGENDENDVYMYGENFESGTYHVGFYDADGTKTCSDGTLTTDTLAAHCKFTGYPTSAYGIWHAVVYKEPNSPPATYVADDADRVVEDSFNVQEGAIPEFPTVIAAIAVCMLCAVAYVVTRRNGGKR